MAALRDATNVPQQRTENALKTQPRPESAALKMQAVARGRTGRRRSIEAARERLGILKREMETTSLTRETATSRSRARGRAYPAKRPTVTSAPPPRERPRRQGAAAPVVVIDEEPKKASAAEFTKEILERVGRREEVTQAIADWTMTVETKDDAVRQVLRPQGPPRGPNRWDVAAKLKAKDAKVLEQRQVLEQMLEQRTAASSLFASVERTLLSVLKAEASRADTAEKLDGSGLREKMDALEKDRENARTLATAAEMDKKDIMSKKDILEEQLLTLQNAFDVVKRERDAARLEAKDLGEALAENRGSGDAAANTTKCFATWTTSAAAKERDDARAALKNLQIDHAKLQSLHGQQQDLLDDALQEKNHARLELEKVTQLFEAEKSKVARAEGAANAASEHYALVRADLEKAHDVRATEVAAAEAQKRRLSLAQTQSLLSEDRQVAAETAWQAMVILLEKEANELRQRVVELEAEHQKSRDRAKSLDGRARDAAEKSCEYERELDIAVQELADLTAKVDRDAAVTEARIAELRDRASSAEKEHRETAAKLAAVDACKSTAEERTMQIQRDLADIEGKLRDNQTELQTTQLKLSETTALLNVETKLRETATDREESERRERTAALAQLLALQERVKSDHDAVDKEISSLQATITAANVAFTAQTADHRRKLDAADALAAERHAEVEALQEQSKHASDIELSQAKGELEGLRRKLDLAERSAKQNEDNTETTIQDLQNRLQSAEDARRRLHNTIQELRGNIRVFARVRPFLPYDNDSKRETPLNLGADGQSVTLSPPQGENGPATDDSPPLFSKARKTSHAFAYDKVFGPSDGQSTVFEEVANFVQSALDGYQVCLFAYGQTGSGKTHTMQGSGVGAMRGIIPRTMAQVTEYLKEKRARGWEYDLAVTYVEIYNENVRDLLGGKETTKHLDIRRDAKTGRTYADGATAVPVDPVSDPHTVDSLLNLAAKTRCVASTDMNAQSSRSHAVFTLHLNGKNTDQGLALNGALHLIDLAGSERLDRSGAVGQRAKEAAAINKSLSALANVFNGLATKQKHVAFRDSKLTFLLQSALLNGKTLVIVNLSPTLASFQESLQTLTFASRVSKIELGLAHRDIVSN